MMVRTMKPDAPLVVFITTKHTRDAKLRSRRTSWWWPPPKRTLVGGYTSNKRTLVVAEKPSKQNTPLLWCTKVVVMMFSWLRWSRWCWWRQGDDGSVVWMIMVTGK
nr:hypothetical protein [Tanacetum cinerariifolium]